MDKNRFNKLKKNAYELKDMCNNYNHVEDGAFKRRCHDKAGQKCMFRINNPRINSVCAFGRSEPRDWYVLKEEVLISEYRLGR